VLALGESRGQRSITPRVESRVAAKIEAYSFPLRREGRYSERVVAERPVCPINLEPDPDGRFALHLALKRNPQRGQNTCAVLRIFTKLILHGTPPEEDPGS
jgi:hypothetical protein